ADADENLRKEGVPESKIKRVGNIMIDALIANLEQAQKSPLLPRYGLKRKSYAYVTLHRPANVDHPAALSDLMKVLGLLAGQIPIIFPIHPLTRKMLAQLNISIADHTNLNIIDPIGYHDSLALTENARMVLTDSGGL